ncbi:MAG: monooxygenase [Campylobacteraceae bacterium]|nr:monooxygenase [Campylobacteraceae bacterium]
MNYILQVDFPHNGHFGDQMSEALADLAKDIAKEEGLNCKYWTECEATKEAGGVYFFEDEENAKRYLEMHTKRLESFGYSDIRGRIFKINKPLSRLSKADI